jgi:hypothetical protein
VTACHGSQADRNFSCPEKLHPQHRAEFYAESELGELLGPPPGQDARNFTSLVKLPPPGQGARQPLLGNGWNNRAGRLGSRKPTHSGRG